MLNHYVLLNYYFEISLWTDYWAYKELRIDYKKTSVMLRLADFSSREVRLLPLDTIEAFHIENEITYCKHIDEGKACLSRTSTSRNEYCDIHIDYHPRHTRCVHKPMCNGERKNCPDYSICSSSHILYALLYPTSQLNLEGKIHWIIKIGVTSIRNGLTRILSQNPPIALTIAQFPNYWQALRFEEMLQQKMRIKNAEIRDKMPAGEKLSLFLSYLRNRDQKFDEDILEKDIETIKDSILEFLIAKEADKKCIMLDNKIWLNLNTINEIPPPIERPITHKLFLVSDILGNILILEELDTKSLGALLIGSILRKKVRIRFLI